MIFYIMTHNPKNSVENIQEGVYWILALFHRFLLTKNRHFTKSFWYCVIGGDYHPPIKLQCRISSQSVDMTAQLCHFWGWGHNSITFGHSVPGSTYFVHCYLGYEYLIKKIRLSMGSYGIRKWFSMQIYPLV